MSIAIILENNNKPQNILDWYVPPLFEIVNKESEKRPTLKIMNTKFGERALWNLLHLWAKYNPGKTEKFIQSLKINYQCCSCRNDLIEWERNNPININELSEWVLNYHNHVNSITNKQKITSYNSSIDRGDNKIILIEEQYTITIPI